MAKDKAAKSVHAWLVMLKAMQAVGRYAFSDLEKAGLGDSDFRVLEALLHRGPLPVNIIGPKVNLTPGSISVAVSRLLNRGLVSRAESPEDRRVRVVALTPAGRALIESAFSDHAARIAEVFADISTGELGKFEAFLKRVGRRAESLFDKN